MAHNLSIIEGTFNQCDAILSKVRQEAAMVKSQVAASPAVSAQDLNSLKRIVEEVKQEVARVQQIKKGGRSRRPHCMIYPNGKAETTPKGMANVFRDFYEDLYKTKGTPTDIEKTKQTKKTKQQAKLHRVTIKEIDKALNELNN